MIIYDYILGKVRLLDLPDFMKISRFGDDKGTIFTEQVSIGTPENPKELVVGEGDSYGVGGEYGFQAPIMEGSAWHCTEANTINTVITNAVDVTTELNSDSDSTVGLFNGESAGNYILIGSDFPYGGNKAKINTLGAVDGDNIVGEYLFDTNTWINVPFMATDANFPYTQKGYTIASCSSCSEQWRFGFDPNNIPTPWNKVTLNINGVDYTKYWSRLRIVADIVLDPIMQQLKLHTNRHETNADGTTEYFGRARYPKTLISGMDKVIQNTLSNPANENVKYGINVTAAYQENEFANGVTDGFTSVQNIEEGLDTSIPLTLSFSWYIKGTATGDVNFHLDIFDIADGFIYDGNAIPRSFEDTIINIPTSSNLVRRTTEIQFPINKLTTTDAILIHLHRDASGGNPLDTLAGNVIITNIKLVGYFWRP